MRLSKAAVYHPHKADMTAQESASWTSNTYDVAASSCITNDIEVKNHFFDTVNRARRKARKAKPSDIDLEGTMKGEKGVRENYTCVTSKILPQID